MPKEGDAVARRAKLLDTTSGRRLVRDMEAETSAAEARTQARQALVAERDALLTMKYEDLPRANRRLFTEDDNVASTMEAYKAALRRRAAAALEVRSIRDQVTEGLSRVRRELAQEADPRALECISALEAALASFLDASAARGRSETMRQEIQTVARSNLGIRLRTITCSNAPAVAEWGKRIESALTRARELLQLTEVPEDLNTRIAALLEEARPGPLPMVVVRCSPARDDPAWKDVGPFPELGMLDKGERATEEE